MNRILICTAGTSIARKTRGLSWTPEDREASRRAIRNSLQETLHQCGGEHAAFLVEASAESNSLHRLHAEAGDIVYLLHTDTPDGSGCAEELARVIQEQLKSTVHLKPIPGLQVKDARRFRREGIQHLITTVDRIIEGHPEQEILLNTTGGFKSVVPYLTLYGLIKRLPVYYIFEQSDTLLKLPPAPISFDFERLSLARSAIATLRREQLMKRDDFFRAIPELPYPDRALFESLIEQEGDLVAPSAFAALLFSEQDDHLAEVRISKSAAASYASSRGPRREQYTFMLERVKDPLWRASKVHPVNGTDLTVYKPGNTSERMLAVPRGRVIYVCELAPHDRYEQLISTRSVADYDLSEFSPWTLPAEVPVPPETEQDLLSLWSRRYDETNAEREEAERLWAESEADRENWKKEAQEFALRSQDAERKIVALQEAQEWTLAEAVQLRQEIEQYKARLRPWWKRWFS